MEKIISGTIVNLCKTMQSRLCNKISFKIIYRMKIKEKVINITLFSSRSRSVTVSLSLRTLTSLRSVSNTVEFSCFSGS